MNLFSMNDLHSILFQAGRLTCYFAGGVMLLIAVVYFYRQWREAIDELGLPTSISAIVPFFNLAFNPRKEIRQVALESLHRRSFAAGLCAIGAFSVPLLFDFNVLLDERANHPVAALIAVYALLFIQISLVHSMATKPRAATLNFAVFFVSAIGFSIAHKANFI